MATKRLAKELGLLRQRSSSSSSSSSTGPNKQLVSNQIFSYIIVIDFESTCWKEKNYYGQEIIEFPAVLLNTSTGEVESEFHSYVQPQERPTLSDFCTELTGITQVEAGLPLHICLSRFSRWLQTLQHQKGLVFPNRLQHTAQPPASHKLCTPLTWSDWDLGVCLQYECKRKQINKPSVLNSWIDLRSTYRLFYNRKPKGLNGALQDLGIRFEGREHSGLDDARNTAHLAARMMREGCVLRITRSLDKISATSIKAAPATKKAVEHDSIKDRVTTNKSSTSACFHKSGFSDQPLTLDSAKNSVQSLVFPKTLLNGTIILREPCKAITTSTNLSTITGYMATSSTTGDVPLLQPDPAEGPFEELIVEGEERCGSYDDVVLDDVTEDFSEFKSASHTSEESIYPAKSFMNSTINYMGNKNTENKSNPTKPGLGMCFTLPRTVGKLRRCTLQESSITPVLLNKSDVSFRKFPNPQVLAPNTIHKPSKEPFSVFTERDDPCSSRSHTSNSVLSHTSNSVLSNLSINTSLNRTSTGAVSIGERRITSPLCSCGWRAKRQQVSNRGPNQGRAFFCCPGRRSGGRDRAQRRCGFFKWESALFDKSGMGTAAVGSSMSLCKKKYSG